MVRVLHVLSQRPSLTGSGVTLDALVHRAAEAGYVQRVVVGIPADDPTPSVGGLAADAVAPLRFERESLDFPVPGMSDVMPYRSTRFSAMTPGQIRLYREAWSDHLAGVVEEFRPELIHGHHVWIVSSLIKDVAPDVPVVTHSHATGLRQMRLCPHLTDGVRQGCRRNDRFLALHGGDAEEIARRLELPAERVCTVGAGYRDELFHARGRSPTVPTRLVYIGKYSAAKGLPWLLDAVERLAESRPEVELHVVGSGAGSEADALRCRMETLAPTVRLHGTLRQPELADLLRTCRVCVLPSFYEGVPLVLVEALACGCRPVATDLPGVRDELAPHLGRHLIRVPLPRMKRIDTPEPRDLPAFVERLTGALEQALDGEPPEVRAELERFTWTAVFRRVEAVWNELR